MALMRFRLPRKVHAVIVGAVVALNVVCFVTIGRLSVSSDSVQRLAKRILSNDNYSSLAPLGTSHNLPITTNHPFLSNPKVKVKVAAVKRYLNETAQTNQGAYPAQRIGRYLMVNPNMCKGVDTVDIIILVHTAPANLAKRQRMRESFAKESLFHPFHVRIAFLLGKTANSTLQRVLWLEHAANNDTVMGDFHDDYHNLTLKGVMGYRVVSEFCPNSRYVLKIDDDVLVNVFKLLYSFGQHMNGKQKSIFCNMWTKGTMEILRRGKWGVEKHLFQNLSRFPYNYCSGFVVIITTDLVKPLYEASKFTPFFWIDDVYLFGILPTMVGGVTYYNYALQKNVTLDQRQAIACVKQDGISCPIFATVIDKSSYWEYWNMILNIYAPSSWNVPQAKVD